MFWFLDWTLDLYKNILSSDYWNLDLSAWKPGSLFISLGLSHSSTVVRFIATIKPWPLALAQTFRERKAERSRHRTLVEPGILVVSYCCYKLRCLMTQLDFMTIFMAVGKWVITIVKWNTCYTNYMVIKHIQGWGFFARKWQEHCKSRSRDQGMLKLIIKMSWLLSTQNAITWPLGEGNGNHNFEYESQVDFFWSLSYFERVLNDQLEVEGCLYAAPVTV